MACIDRYERLARRACGCSIAAFLLCAAAPSFGSLLFFRFLQGVSAGLIPFLEAILTEQVALRASEDSIRISNERLEAAQRLSDPGRK